MQKTFIWRGLLLSRENSKLEPERRPHIMTFVNFMTNKNMQMFSSAVREDDSSWLATSNTGIIITTMTQNVNTSLSLNTRLCGISHATESWVEKQWQLTR